MLRHARAELRSYTKPEILFSTRSARRRGGQSLAKTRAGRRSGPVVSGLPPGLAFLKHRQDVARRVLEPGDVRSPGPVNALLVLASLGQAVVPFQPHSPADQFVDGRVDVVHLEVQDRV